MSSSAVKRISIVIAGLMGSSILAAEKQTVFESEETPTTLIELFTSEGCSSCPPADAWMSRLKNSADLWKKFVPVVWHVDYWDRLGWRDRFAKPEFTARQQRYTTMWKGESAYTPAFVVNGYERRDWLQKPEPITFGPKFARLTVSLDENNHVSAKFAPIMPSIPPKERFLHVALLGFDLESDVSRGENSGRKLRHNFVVLAYAQNELLLKDNAYSGELSLPNEQLPGKPAALAAWVTHNELAPFIQATGGWLNR